MPKYEYKCPECNSVKELNFPHQHVLCDKEMASMKRVYSIAGISFKGSGFYKTDNKE